MQKIWRRHSTEGHIPNIANHNTTGEANRVAGDPTKPYEVTTNASKLRIGAVILHRDASGDPGLLPMTQKPLLPKKRQLNPNLMGKEAHQPAEGSERSSS